MWIKRRNCFDSDEDYEKYLREHAENSDEDYEKYLIEHEENSDRMDEIRMGWRDSDGYPLVSFL